MMDKDAIRKAAAEIGWELIEWTIYDGTPETLPPWYSIMREVVPVGKTAKPGMHLIPAGAMVRTRGDIPVRRLLHPCWLWVHCEWSGESGRFFQAIPTEVYASGYALQIGDKWRR